MLGLELGFRKRTSRNVTSLREKMWTASANSALDAPVSSHTLAASIEFRVRC